MSERDDKWFVPEGDLRCGYRHKPTGATCLLRRDHDGPHRNTQGYWSALPQFNDPPAPAVSADTPEGPLRDVYEAAKAYIEGDDPEAWEQLQLRVAAVQTAPAVSADTRLIALADIRYVTEWLRQTNAPENIIGLAERVADALAAVRGGVSADTRLIEALERIANSRGLLRTDLKAIARDALAAVRGGGPA